MELLLYLLLSIWFEYLCGGGLICVLRGNGIKEKHLQMSDKIVHPYVLNVFIALSLLQVSSGTSRNVKFKESKSKDIFDAVAA